MNDPIYVNDDMMVMVAVGDAYGVALEYVDKHPDHDAIIDFRKYHAHPIYHKTVSPGQYTDDTQMSIAVAETLIDGKSLFNKLTWADAFVRCFRRDPRKGYSSGFQKVLEQAQTGEELMELVDGTSDKNGAAMRSVPLGVVSDPEKLVEIAEVQASVTHAGRGILASVAVALMSHYSIYVRDKDHDFAGMLDWLVTFDARFQEFKKPWEGRVGWQDVGMKTAHAVSTLLVNEGRAGQCVGGVLRQALEWGGDTDSVAAIACGIASARFVNDLPTFMFSGLEAGRGQYGMAFLDDLTKKLFAARF